MKCCKCLEDLDESQFYPCKIKNRNYICKECCRKERRERYKNRNQPKQIKNTKTKICNKCNKEKDLDKFYKKKRGQCTGYSYQCIECVKSYQQDKEVKNRKNHLKRKKMKENPHLRVKNNLCKRIWGLIKGEWKSKTLWRYLGIPYPKFMEWIKFQFNSKMTMENYGFYWHIDHTDPCNNFDLKDEKQMKKCFHWINLRPLEKIENLIKNAKIQPFEVLKQQIKAHHFNKFYLVGR
jgi:hypothetical protein